MWFFMPNHIKYMKAEGATSHMEDDSYIVEMKPQDESAKRDGCLGVFILIAIIGSNSIFSEVENMISRVLSIIILLIGFCLLIMQYMPKKPGKKIRVSEECFTVIEAGKEGRTYRFSEITRVSLHFSYRVSYRACKSTSTYWRIDVGKKCAATFTQEMENSSRLLIKLDELGLITKYATGYRT